MGPRSAGGFFDRLVETCPMRLTSNNAPEVRDLIATVMVSMVNGRDARCPGGAGWRTVKVTSVRTDAEAPPNRGIEVEPRR